MFKNKHLQSYLNTGSEPTYNKILAIFNTGNSSNVITKAGRASVTLKSQSSYESDLASLSDSDYDFVAGTDISSIFFPFEASTGSGSMPNFQEATLQPSSDSDITLYELLPFKISPNDTSIEDRTTAASGDAITSVVSGSGYMGNSVRYRDNSVVRSMGLRAPIILVGWGYTTDGDPWPYDSSDSTKFKGGKTYGWEMDPKDYVAAPLDVRYDEDRHVWAATGGSMSKHRHLVNANTDGGPAFATFFADTPAEASGLGYVSILQEAKSILQT